MLVPQLSRAISSRRESERRRAEAWAAAQRELIELARRSAEACAAAQREVAEVRARVEAQSVELQARDDELARHRDQISALVDVVASLRNEIRETGPERNGQASSDQITSLLESEQADEESSRADEGVARQLATREDRELAEIFDTALRTWAIRDRLGAYEEAEDWRQLALATVREASTRTSFNGHADGGKRRLRGQAMRRLAEACEAHTLAS